MNPKYWSFPPHSLLLFNVFKTGPLCCAEQMKQWKCKELAEPSDAIRMLFFDVVNIPVCLTGLWHFDFFFYLLKKLRHMAADKTISSFPFFSLLSD